MNYRIKPLDEEAMALARLRWDGIAKPLGSLGKLEDAIVQLAGISGSAHVSLKKKALLIFCADNGVVEEGVSQSGSEITACVAENFLNGKACAAVLCKKAGVDLFPVDIGMAADVPGMVRQKVAYGTKNLAKAPAMTRAQAEEAIFIGMEQVRRLKEEGYGLVATGEMGIGNTTTSSAIAAVLLQLPVEEVTGRGAGLSSEGLARKVDVIKKAIALHNPDATDPLDVLSKLGGFDIAGMAGAFLGGAVYQMPVVIDGLISALAALVAIRLDPACGAYMLPSHVSKEPAAKHLLKALKKEAFLDCDLHLGEGSGALMLLPLLELALEVYTSMSTFEEAGFSQYAHLE